MAVSDILAKIPRPKLRGDRVLWICVLLFAIISVLAVFSSSTFIANRNDLPKTAIFFSQLKSVGIGFFVLLVCYLVPMRFYRRLAFPIFAVTLVLLLASLIFGEEVNGAQRGLRILGRTFQPLEFAKIGLILYLAKALEMWKDSLDTFKDFALKLLLPIGGACLLVLPNSVSTVILFGVLSFLLMFFMGVKFRFLLISLGAAIAALALLLLIYNAVYAGKTHAPGEPVGKVEKFFNRVGTAQSRVMSFASKVDYDDPEVQATLSKEEIDEMRDHKRQSENAKIAISQGGLFGKGPGKSTQRYSLSMAFSDFIFAFIIEEYGLAGGCVVILLYIFVLFRCIRITRKCSTTFTEALILGLSWLIALQATLHIYVNVRILPVTGHTLPFISHGGTAYIVLSAAMGMILSVSRHLQKKEEEEQEQQLQEAQLQEASQKIQTEETDNGQED